MEMNDLLHAAVDSDASDILLVTDAPPMFRIDGELKTTALEPLDPETIRDLCDQVLKEKQKETLEKQKDVDFAITIPRLGVFVLTFTFSAGRWRQPFVASLMKSPA